LERLAALGRERELEGHLRGAFHQGFDRDQIVELMIHVAHYAGWPAGHTGVRTLEKLLEREPSAGRQMDVGGSPMRFLFETPHGPHPAVIVIHHGEGVLPAAAKDALDQFTKGVVERLGADGYVAVAPDLFHRRTDADPDWLARRDDDEISADVEATIDWLREHPAVDPERIGILGFSMGGRVAYLMAARSAHLKAAVVCYGGNLTRRWPIPAGETEPQARSPLQLTSEIRCPVLFLYGTADGLLRSAHSQTAVEYASEIGAALERAGVPHQVVSYEGAPHNFMNSFGPVCLAKIASVALVGTTRACSAGLLQGVLAWRPPARRRGTLKASEEPELCPSPPARVFAIP
jgi:carboxymethylenebutenolidase